MFSFFKPKCRSFTDIFNNFTDEGFKKPHINHSLKSVSIFNEKIIELKNITQIKYIPVQKKKTLMKFPKEVTQTDGLLFPTIITTYDFIEVEEIIKPACLTNIDHHGENIDSLIRAKLTQIENETYETIISPLIKISNKIQFDFNTLDSYKYYNVDLQYKITFINNTFIIQFFLHNIQENIIQQDTDPV